MKRHSPLFPLFSLTAAISFPAGCVPLFSGTVEVSVSAAESIPRDLIRVSVFPANAGGLARTDGLDLETAPPDCRPYFADVDDDSISLTPLKSYVVDEEPHPIQVEDLIQGPMALVAWVDDDGDGRFSLPAAGRGESCTAATREIDGEVHALVGLQFREGNPSDPYDGLTVRVEGGETGGTEFLRDEHADAWVFILEEDEGENQ